MLRTVVVRQSGKMLSKKLLLLGFLCCAVIAINARYVSEDMEVAASGKHEEWKKGGGKDHFEDEHSSHGDKGATDNDA